MNVVADAIIGLVFGYCLLGVLSGIRAKIEGRILPASAWRTWERMILLVLITGILLAVEIFGD